MEISDFTRNILGSTIRLHLTDGRVLEGLFLSIDRAFNFVIEDCTEYHIDPSSKSRLLGLAIVPGGHVTKCALKSSAAENC
jgi:small nuclear ribonucleoprotein (snRNP)-like protein